MEQGNTITVDQIANILELGAEQSEVDRRVVALERGTSDAASVFVHQVRMSDGSTSTKLESIKPFLDQYLKAPELRKGTAEVRSIGSFIEHANRFKDKDSAIFAFDDSKSPTLTAVLDYHPAGEPDAGARFGAHRTLYRFPLSDEWMAWTGIAGRAIDQRSFAEFLEDRIEDVLEPTVVPPNVAALAARLGLTLASCDRLLELSRGLSVNVDTKVKNVQNLSTGEASIVFEESHRDGGAPLKVPNGFVISIPIFRGGATYALPVRLRYRIKADGVSWTVVIARADEAFRNAFMESCVQAQSATELPLFYGAPE